MVSVPYDSEAGVIDDRSGADFSDSPFAIGWLSKLDEDLILGQFGSSFPVQAKAGLGHLFADFPRPLAVLVPDFVEQVARIGSVNLIHRNRV